MIYVIFLCFRVNAAKLKILPNVLHQIGNTPLVQINKIPKSVGLQCQICKLSCIFWIANYSIYETFGSFYTLALLTLILDVDLECVL